MLCESNLPKYFWAETINTAYYILNRTLIRPIHKKTSYELWNDQKSNISYFHVFGYKCFIHNNEKKNLGKFDARSDEGIFLGYSISSKAHRVFNKNSRAVEESIHVVFDESIGKPKDIDEEDDKVETPNKDIQQLEQRKDVESLENNQELEEIEPIDPSLPIDWKYAHSHPKDQIIGDPSQEVKTRSYLKNINNYLAFVS